MLNEKQGLGLTGVSPLMSVLPVVARTSEVAGAVETPPRASSSRLSQITLM